MISPPFRLLALCAAALGLVPLAAAQSTKPLTESELLKTIDSIGSGDPRLKAPLSTTQPDGKPNKSADAKPDEDKAKKDKSAGRSKGGSTEITADEGAFDQHSHQAVFSRNVTVKNPDFSVTCDKLTAYLKQDAVKAGAAAGATAPKPETTPRPPRLTTPGGTPKPAGEDKAGGLEKAVAEGNVVINQDKLDTDGKMTHNIGRGKKAIYDSATGDVTLSGKPEVEQGINTCVATDEATIIILNRDGQMKTIGPAKFIIKDSGSDTANAR